MGWNPEAKARDANSYACTHILARPSSRPQVLGVGHKEGVIWV